MLNFYSNKSFQNACMILFFLFQTLNIYAQNWTKIDGTADYINRIIFPPSDNQMMIVSSDSLPTDIFLDKPRLFFRGFGYNISNDGGKTFAETKLDSFSVLDIMQIPLSPDTWLASISFQNRGAVVISNDGGNTWDVDDLGCQGTHQIAKFAANENYGEMFFAAAVSTSRGFLYTDDKFRTCRTNENLNIQSHDIVISKKNPNWMFIAGDNYYEGGVFRSSDSGAVWTKEESGLKGLRILCVLPSSLNLALVYCGADSIDRDEKYHGKGIYQSLDTGKTWELIAAEGARVFALAEHPSSPKYLAAACGETGVWASANYGYSWRQYKDGFPEGASVRAVAIPGWEPNEDGFIAFAGTFGHGLYQSGRMITSVNEEITQTEKLIIKSVYPQPFDEKVSIIFSNPEPQSINFTVRNIFGNIIYSETISFSIGEHSFIWRPSQETPSGIYYIIIETGISRVLRKVVYL